MSNKGNWEVIMECVVRKNVYCEDCTEEEAKANPWDHAKEETEMEQVDWEVLKVTAAK